MKRRGLLLEERRKPLDSAATVATIEPHGGADAADIASNGRVKLSVHLL